MNSLVVVVLMVVQIGLLVALFVLRDPIRLRMMAALAGVRIPFFEIMRMKRAGLDAAAIVHRSIGAAKVGLPLDFRDLVRHASAGGDTERVVRALMMADVAAVPLSPAAAFEMDLAGRDPAQWVTEESARTPRATSGVGPWMASRGLSTAGIVERARPTRLESLKHALALPLTPLIVGAAARKAARAGLGVGAGALLSDWFFRGSDPRPLVEAAIGLRQGGVAVPFEDLRMLHRLRFNLAELAGWMLTAKRAGVDLDLQVGALLLEGGESPEGLIEAMRIAKQSGWDLTSEQAAEFIFAGHDPVTFVRASLNQPAGAGGQPRNS